MSEIKLRPLSEAPKEGHPIEHVLAVVRDFHGNRNWVSLHYAYGGGDEQPPFRGWFRSDAYGHSEVLPRDIEGWLYVLPHLPLGSSAILPAEPEKAQTK